jgi:hypothetical protein
MFIPTPQGSMATTQNAGKEKAKPTADEVENRKELYSLAYKT